MFPIIGGTEAGIEERVTYVDESINHEEDFHFLRFEFLQRLNILNLEIELAQMKVDMQGHHKGSPHDFERLCNKLEQYATAIRNYQYLQDKRPLSESVAVKRKQRLHKYFYFGDGKREPWASHYSYFEDQEPHQSFDPLRRLIMNYLPSQLTFSRRERSARAKEFNDGLPPRGLSTFVDILARFIIAMAGGILLVVPMVIMIYSPSEKKSVITVSVAVLIVALILSFGIKVSDMNTLVSTATFAAVLVVFVGTSTGGDSAATSAARGSGH